MCLFKSPPKQEVEKSPAPEAPGEEEEIGSARKAEDEELFGGTVPDLRVDRTAVEGGVGATGTGLKVM